jgi:hypothetical protein
MQETIHCVPALVPLNSSRSQRHLKAEVGGCSFAEPVHGGYETVREGSVCGQ